MNRRFSCCVVRRAFSHYGATNPHSHLRGLRCEVVKPAAQSRIRKELVACLKYDFLVWMSTRTPSLVAVAEPDGEVRSAGHRFRIAWNRSARLMGKLGSSSNQFGACYEAGATGYALYWQSDGLGVPCDVIAPSLIPRKGRRSGENRSPRCGEAGTQLSSRRPDGGLGARLRRTKRCAIWCARAKMPNRISFEPNTA